MQTALGLGWQLAELYHESAPTAAPSAELPEALPGLSRLDHDRLLEMRLAQVDVALQRLNKLVRITGPSRPDTESLRQIVSQGPETVAKTDFRREVLRLHCDLLTGLTAGDFRIGKAYGLGRALADLCMRPQIDDPKSFFIDFSTGGRIDTVKGWLRDLKTVLPDHASEAVLGSLGHWQSWAIEPTIDFKALEWSRDGTAVTRALDGQGRRWRAVLTGERMATDLLSAEDFIIAGEALLARMRQLARRFLRQFWPVLVAIVVVAILAVAVVSFLNGANAVTKLAGYVAAGLAATGVSWKTISATLSKVAAKAEPILWEAEIDSVAIGAATLLPAGAPPVSVMPVPPPRPRVVRRGEHKHRKGLDGTLETVKVQARVWVENERRREAKARELPR